MGPRPGLVRNALGSLAVLAAIAFIAFGLPVIDRSIPSNRPVAADRPFEVGAGTALRPPRGSTVDLTRTRPDDDRGTAVFLLDGFRLQVVAAPFRGDLGEAARRLRGKITNASGYQVIGGERAVTTQAGVHGRRGAYSSSGLLGQYAVFVHDGVSVEITMSGPEDRLREVGPAWDDSLRSLAFDGPRS